MHFLLLCFSSRSLHNDGCYGCARFLGDCYPHRSHLSFRLVPQTLLEQVCISLRSFIIYVRYPYRCKDCHYFHSTKSHFVGFSLCLHVIELKHHENTCTFKPVSSDHLWEKQKRSDEISDLLMYVVFTQV